MSRSRWPLAHERAREKFASLHARRAGRFALSLLVAAAAFMAANGGLLPEAFARQSAPPKMDPLLLALHEEDATRELRFAPWMVLDGRAEADELSHAVTLAPEWKSESGGGNSTRFVAVVDEPPLGVHATLVLVLDGHGGAELTVDVDYREKIWLGLSALDFSLPGKSATVFDRDLMPRTVSSTSYLDRFATKKIRVGDVTVLVEDGVDGVVLRRSSVDSSQMQVRVELFSVEARPFHHCTRCTEDWHGANSHLPLGQRLRRPGDHDHAHLSLRGSDGPVLAKSRYPDGRSAAVLITDHADQTAPDTFTALARGRSDTIHAVGGLLGHHLVITKSLFLRGEFNGEGRRQLEDLRVSAVAEEMADSGSEIVPHSITPNPDEREATAEGLDRFDRYHATTWIDHQPETNCEAFTNQGWRGPADRFASRYRIADLLAQHGYRYIWSAVDQPELDLVWSGRLDKRALTLWPLGRIADDECDATGDGRWLFKTVWMLVDQSRFYRILGQDRLDRLERDRGLAILHTYLEALHDASDPRFGMRNVLRRAPGGAVVTDPRFEKVLDDLQRRVDRGSLWVPTLRVLGDYLRAVDEVRVRYASDGTATVQAPVAVSGLTFVVQASGAAEARSRHHERDKNRDLHECDPAERIRVLIDGKPPRGQRVEHGALTFWFDLAAARATRIELLNEWDHTPFLVGAPSQRPVKSVRAP